MEAIYQIGFYKQCDQTKIRLDVECLGMTVFFGEKGGKRYATIAEYKRRGPSRSGGRWHGNPGVWDVYHRTNFWTREAGNAAYSRVKKLFESFRECYSGCIECNGYVTFDQVKNALMG